MGELLEEAIVGAIRDFSVSSFGNLWAVTVLAALSTCSILKMLLVVGYLAVLKLSDWKRILANVCAYVLGMGFSYLLIAIIIARLPFLMRTLVPGSSIIFFLTGSILIAFGLVALGLIRTHVIKLDLLLHRDPEHDYLVSFLLGALIVAMEALSCLVCNPTLKLIVAIYSKKGSLFASLIFGTFFLGQSTLPILAGLILGPLKQLMGKSENYEYIQIAGAIILVLVGLDLLWLL